MRRFSHAAFQPALLQRSLRKHSAQFSTTTIVPSKIALAGHSELPLDLRSSIRGRHSAGMVSLRRIHGASVPEVKGESHFRWIETR